MKHHRVARQNRRNATPKQALSQSGKAPTEASADARTHLNVLLPDSLVAAIDQAAESGSTDRATFIRDAIVEKACQLPARPLITNENEALYHKNGHYWLEVDDPASGTSQKPVSSEAAARWIVTRLVPDCLKSEFAPVTYGGEVCRCVVNLESNAGKIKTLFSLIVDAMNSDSFQPDGNMVCGLMDLSDDACGSLIDTINALRRALDGRPS